MSKEKSGISNIEVNLFGKPIVYFNRVPIVFPFKQAEALFYYLAIEGQSTKSKLADYIWGDKYTEERINSNMRNALYVLRKIFGKEFLTTISKNIVKMNKNIDVHVDCIEFIKDNTPNKYKGDFLDGFYLKNNEMFNEWIDLNRQSFKNTYLKRLKDNICTSFKKGNFDFCEHNCFLLMKADEFDELSYKYLISVYNERKEFNKSINIYNKMVKFLSEELFEMPSKEITTIVDQIKKERSQEILSIISSKNKISSDKEYKNIFYGRANEIILLNEIVDKFLKGITTCSTVIVGEEGVGKTLLATNFLDNIQESNNISIVKAYCYREEEMYILKPWETLIEQVIEVAHSLSVTLDDTLMERLTSIFPFLDKSNNNKWSSDDIATIKYDSLVKNLVRFLQKISKKKKLVIFIDDIQWADEKSILLIRNVITSDKNQNILFVFTCREQTNPYIETFVSYMKIQKFFRIINLQRFSYQETASLAELLLPKYSSTDEIKKQLYKETEGNAFFVIEMLKNIKYNGSLYDITPNIRDVIRNRISRINHENKMILDLLSLFFNGVSFEVLLFLSNKEEYELLEILEDLINKKLIREESRLDNIKFYFSHQKTLEYVYNEMSFTKKKFFHEKIGVFYESKLENSKKDMLIYTELIYHFNKSGNKQKNLKYLIKYVYNYLNTVHEFFPIVDDKNVIEEYNLNFNFSISNIKEIDITLFNISKMVNEVIEQVDDVESLELLCEFYHMIGRNYIRNGEYEEGLKHIKKLKELCKTYDNKINEEYLIKANRQLACIYINTYDCKNMNETIEESFKILCNNSKSEEIAIWKRLNGLNQIMMGNMESGITSLTEAINIFENSNSKEKYQFNLAASYAWLGETQRNQKKYDDAMMYYTKALDICTKNNLTGGISTFYLYAGICLYNAEKFLESKYYFEKSIYYYELTDLLWQRAIVYGYYSLVLFKEENYEKTKNMLKKAWECSEKIHSNYEKGIIFKIYAAVCIEMNKDMKVKNSFRDIIKEDITYYTNKAEKLLGTVAINLEL